MGHMGLSLQFFEKWSICTYVAQRSMFPYTLRITPQGLSKIMNLPERRPEQRDEAIEGGPTKKAMKGLTCKLSMLVDITLYVVCVCNTPVCGPSQPVKLTSSLGRMKIAIHSYKVNVSIWYE